MNKTFGDLKTGDIIYYIAFDEHYKVYKIYEHNVFVHKPNNICIIENCIVIDIKIKPGDLYSHKMDDLSLPNNETFKRWSKHTTNSKGLGVTVDYDEAKKMCLSFMRQYCEMMRDESKKVISEMYNAIYKFTAMERDFVEHNKY